MCKILGFKSGLIIIALLFVLIGGKADGSAIYFSETFEAEFTDGAPPGWTKSFKTGTNDWIVYQGDCHPGSKAHSGNFNAMLFAADSISDHETWLITPVIAFPAGVSNTKLEFWHKQTDWQGDQDTLVIYYKTSETGNWIHLQGYTSSIQNWTKRTISLPNPCATYYIGFLGNAKYGYGVCIDDVKVTGKTTGDGITNYYAVICGIADYQNVGIPDLEYGANDAMDVCDALLSSKNWSSDNIVLLTDSQATKNNIRTSIEDMALLADDDDVCLFFFSGHGINGSDTAPYDESDGADEYLGPYDSMPDSYDNDIRDDEFAEWIGRLPTDKYAILLDSCAGGGMIKGFGSTECRPKGFIKQPGIISQNGDGFVADITELKSAGSTDLQARDLGDSGRGVVLTACADDESSYESDEMENGVFTYYLVEALTGAADSDRDGRISAEECHKYIKVPAANYTRNEPGGAQQAQMYDAVSGELDLFISHAVITKCTVKAGKIRNAGGTDSISVSGQTTFDFYDFSEATSVAITISSELIEPWVLTFPVDGSTFKNGKFSSSQTDANGIKKSFKCNTKTHKFNFSAKNIDLTGLNCPLTFDINLGDINEAVQIDETLVNRKKNIPIILLMGVSDTLDVTKIKLKQRSKISSDQLSVKGSFSVLTPNVNMAEENLYLTLDTQTWTIPAGSFVAKKGKFNCSKIAASPSAVAAASFNFNKGAFKLSLKAADINDIHGSVGLRLMFDDYDQVADVDLP
jgi:hypothetical protein